MGPAYFVIAILGCGDGAVGCTPALTVPTRYSTLAACTAATEPALERANDLDFPTLVAECRPIRSGASAPRRAPAPASRG